MEQYDIAFKGLKTGMHSFGFDLEDSFFDHFDNADCKGGTVRVDAAMEKKDHLLSFLFMFSGTIRVVCDRCLEIFDMPMSFQCPLYVRFGEDNSEADADVIYLATKEHKLNLLEFFNENIYLNLPLKRVHPVGGNGIPLCNREMLDNLEKHLVKEDKERTDPRWDSLKGLIDKKN